MQPTTTATTGKPGLSRGALVGVILGIVYLILYAASGATGKVGIGGLVAIVFTILIYIFAIVAGAMAAAKNGKVTSGLVAGLLVGLIGTILGTVGALIFDNLNLDQLVKIQNQAAQTLGSTTQVTNSSYLTTAIIGSIVIIIVNTLIGLGLGALGGLIGRGRAPKPAPALYADSLYTGNLTPTAPIYPPQQQQQQGYPPAGYPPEGTPRPPQQ